MQDGSSMRDMKLNLKEFSKNILKLITTLEYKKLRQVCANYQIKKAMFSLSRKRTPILYKLLKLLLLKFHIQNKKKCISTLLATNK